MQISGTNAFSQLRQLSSANRDTNNNVRGQAGQRLTFVYPMIVDSSVSKYANLCRDFLAVEVIGHVKVSNVLNITSQASRINSVPNVLAVNPSHEVIKSMGELGYGQYQSNPYDYTQDPRIVQDKINSFNSFIRNQLKHDPKYSNLRPMISNLSFENNLIQVPIIVGTKQFPLKATMLYWVLVASVLNNSDMTNSQDISNIINSIKNIPDDKFMHLMFTTDGRKRLLDATGITSSKIGTGDLVKPTDLYDLKATAKNVAAAPLTLPINTISSLSRTILHPSQTATNVKHGIGVVKNAISNPIATAARHLPDPNTVNPHTDYRIAQIQRVGRQIKTELDNVAIIFKIVTNYQKWAADTNNVQNEHFSIDTVVSIDESPAQRRAHLAAAKAFSNYASLILRPFIMSIEKLFGPIPDDISSKARDLLDFINDDLLDEFWTLLQHVRGQITYGDSEMDGRSKIANFDAVISKFRDLCFRNSSPEFVHSIKNMLFDDLIPNLEVNVNFTGEHLVRFVDKLTSAGNECQARLTAIRKEFGSILPDGRDFNITFDSIRQSITEEVSHFLYGNPAIVDRTGTIAEFCDRHQYWYLYICNSRQNEQCRDFAIKVANTIHESLVNILSFLFIWNFTAYLCEYLGEVQLDVYAKRRDVTDFPNYCLVVPIYVIKNLYMVMTNRNLKNAIFHGQVVDHTEGDTIANLGDLKRVIELVNKQLKVPNLIVIDEKSEDFYYLLMHMDKPIKSKVSTIKTYVEHQQDVLQGF